MSLPIQIDGGQSNQSTVFANNAMYGPFAFAGSIYVPLVNPAGGVPMTMNVSTDGGTTWTIADAVNGPVCRNYAAVQVGFVIVVVYNTGLPGVQISVTLFNCLTDTWTGLVTSTAVAVEDILGVQYRQVNGDILILYAASDGAGNWIYNALPYNGTFSAPLSLNAGFDPPSTTGSFYSLKSCVDSDGRVHCFMGYVAAPSTQQVYYRAVEPGDTLGSSAQFPVNGAGNLLNANSVGGPVASAGSIIWPADIFSFPNAVIYIGSPQTAPVWSGPVIIDPVFISSPGNAALIGSQLVVTNVSDDSSSQSSNAIRIAVTSDLTGLTGWSAAYALDGAIPPIVVSTFSEATAGDDGFGNAIVIFDALDSVTFQNVGFAFASALVPPIVLPTANNRIASQGLPSYALPSIAYADNTGANSCCFPICITRGMK